MKASHAEGRARRTRSLARTLTLVALACLSACSGPAARPHGRTSDRPAHATREPGAYVAVVHHDGTSAQASLLPIALEPAGTRPLAARTIGTLAEPGREGHVRVLAAHDGGARLVVVEGTGEGARALVLSLEGGASHAIPLSNVPAAALLDGARLLLGERLGVSWVDLEGEGAPRSLVERPTMQGKAYDVFARDGDLVVAIDDLVVPIYADSLRLGSVPSHVAGFEMPGIVNGTYRLAALARTGEGEGTLYAVAPYGVMDGDGQDLVALRVVGGRVDAPPRFVINATRSTDPPVLEEHVSRSTRRVEKIAAGDHVTPFTGLAVVRRAGAPFRLALAAGDRGLLLVPLDFGPDTRADAVDLGAPCTDVLARGDRLFALAGAALVELSASSGSLVVVRRTALPAAFESFVH